MDKDVIEEAVELFKQSDDAWREVREAALDDIKFARLAQQWPEDMKSKRDAEGRPCLTINRMPVFIRQVVNDARMNRPSIKVHPADSGADIKTADVMSGLIRNIEYSSNADTAYDTAVDAAVTGGFGFFRIDVDYAHNDTFDLDILIRRMENQFSVHWDHRSVEADSSDWNYCFVDNFLSKKEFEKKYPGAEYSDFAGEDESHQLWIDEDGIRVAEYWTRDEIMTNMVKLSNGAILDEARYLELKDMLDMSGINVTGSRPAKSWEVKQRIITGKEVLEETPWKGMYIPIVPVWGDEVNVEGKRYFRSLIRDAKDPQRMFNYWRTTTTELIALAPKAPFIGPQGAFTTDLQKWQSANTETHSFIEYDGAIAPQRQPFTGVPAGPLQEALNASDDMKAIMGIYDASLGARSNETSGRAIMARQREGDVSTFHFMDNLNRAIRHAGRILIDLIPKTHDKPRILRIMGEDGTPSAIMANQPIQKEDGTEEIFDLSNGKYDLTVSSGPSFTTRREESAYQMTELVRAYPAVAPLIGDLIAKNLDWPGADEIAKRMQAMLPPQINGEQQIPPQVQQQMQQHVQQLQQMQQALQQMQSENQQLKIGKAEKMASAQNDADRLSLDFENLKVDQYRAETERLKLTQESMSPEAIQELVMQTLQQIQTPQDLGEIGDQGL